MLLVIDVKWSPGIVWSSTSLPIADQPSEGRKSFIVSERNTASRPGYGAGSYAAIDPAVAREQRVVGRGRRRERRDRLALARRRRIAHRQAEADRLRPPRHRGVHDDDQRNLFVLREQLPRHLDRDERAVAVAGEEIGAVRARLAQRDEALARHRLDRVGNRRVVEAVRMHRVERLVGAERAREAVAVEAAAAEVAVQEEQRRPRAAVRQRHRHRSR